VFSISLVLYEMLTGRRVFDERSAYAVAMAMATRDIEPPSLWAPQPIDKELDRIVLKGAAREKGARFSSAIELAEALDALASSQGVPSLESYVSQAFGEQQKKSRRWLQTLINTPKANPEPPAKQPGRSTDVATRVLANSNGRELGQQTGEQVQEALTVQETPNRREPEQLGPANRRTPVLVALLTLGALVIVGSVFFLARLGAKNDSVAQRADAGTQRAATDLAPTADQASSPRRDGGRLDSGHVDQALDQKAKSSRSAPRTKTKGKAKTLGGRHRHRRGRAAKTHGNSTAPKSMQTAKVRDSLRTKPRSAYLSVGATPYAFVRIDGKFVGPTPLVRYRVSAGKHVVELLFPASRKLRWRKTVMLAPEQRRRLVAPPAAAGYQR
jgi:hypothetical protein